MSLKEFVRESNRIEGMYHPPTDAEVEAHAEFLLHPGIMIPELERFVGVIQPGARLRNCIGLNVRVGDHFPPRGGSEIVGALSDILYDVSRSTPYQIHQRYETLHPFTDGNGRSGRVLWLWMHKQSGRLNMALARGFLHSWYYESLSGGRP